MPDPDEALRLFLTAALPTEAQREIAGLLAQLPPAALPGWRRTHPEAIHLTLRFLGETPPDRARAATAALRRAAAASAPFRLALGAGGTFGGRRPRVLWLGLTGDLEALQALANALNDELRREGWERPDRPLRPHITLARARRGAAPAQAAARSLAAGLQPSRADFPIAAARLVRSVLAPSGARHSTIAEAALGGAVP